MRESKDLAAEAWQVEFNHYQACDERRREAITALGNGVLVVRGAFPTETRGPNHYPGTYRAGCYERLISAVAGDIDETESLANLPNWLALGFRIEGGEWFCLDTAQFAEYRHQVQLDAGTSARDFTLIDACGRRTRVVERRLASMADPNLAALQLELTPLNWSGEVALGSGLSADVVNANVERYHDYEQRHIVVTHCEALDASTLICSLRTRHSGIELTMAVRTDVHGGRQLAEDAQGSATGIAVTRTLHLREGETLAVEKCLALRASDDDGDYDADQAVRAALAGAGDFASLLAEHQQAWQQLWQRCEIGVQNPQAALALRFNAFHILQTVSPHTRALDVGVPARGWHGEVYRGHVFWDELFVLPFLNFRFPELSRSLLLYRYRRLDEARSAAKSLGLRGAMYPWRSAKSGCEVTPRWQKNLVSGHWMRDPTRLQRHIGAAIAVNIWRYYLATGDRSFLLDYGAEIILEIARFWASIAQYSEHSGRYEIKGVIGPDEYHNSYPGSDNPGLDNNAYTNLAAVWTLCCALQLLDHLPPEQRQPLVQRLNLEPAETDLWDAVSRRMYVPFHDGMISQFEGFNRLKPFNGKQLPQSLGDARTDWALEAMGETADGYQVVKQADTLALLYLFEPHEVLSLLARLGYRYDKTDLLRTVEYYLPRTTHRSSLSRAVYAGALAGLDLPRSWHFYQHSMEVDLQSLRGESTAEGIHLGAMGATLDVLQRHYLGVRAELDGLRIDPCVPQEFGRVVLTLSYRGQWLRVEAERSRASVRAEATNGHAVRLIFGDKQTELRPGEVQSLEGQVFGECADSPR